MAVHTESRLSLEEQQMTVLSGATVSNARNKSKSVANFASSVPHAT